MEISREESQRDALLLKRIVDGDDRYHDLAGGMERADLDLRLDRLKDVGYLAFRFTGRRLVVTDGGRRALDRAYARGWRYGRLVDARALYPRFLPVPR